MLSDTLAVIGYSIPLSLNCIIHHSTALPQLWGGNARYFVDQAHCLVPVLLPGAAMPSCATMRCQVSQGKGDLPDVPGG